MITLTPNYIRKTAATYKLLRSGEPADPKILETVQKAAQRCINAHMRDQLRLAADVRLPMATVLMMLEYVRDEATARLEPVPQPDDLAPTELTPAGRSFLQRAAERLQALVGAA